MDEPEVPVESSRVKKRPTLLESEELIKASGYRIRYQAFGAAKTLFSTKDDEVLLAGPAGTGKSLAALHKLHLAASKYKDSRMFMARKTRTSMTNSCMETFDRHVLKPPDKVHFHKTDQQYNYPNGSVIAVIGLDDPERIKSTDWDMGFIQEATECTENDWEIATTRLRNWIMPYQQLLADCNPDKPTHWIKKRCDAGLTTILVSVHQDNPRLYNIHTGQWSQEGMQYLGKLDRLSGVRRKRLYEGLWVAAEGLIYENWNDQVHLISLSEMPKGWEEWSHYWSLDWGYVHPLVWQDWVEDPDTLALYRVREMYMTGMLVEDAAREIMELTEGIYIPRAIICDHDAGDRATFERHTGYLTLPAYKPIQQGIQAVERRFRCDWHFNRPGLFLVRDALLRVDKELEAAGKPTCTEKEIDGYVWDEKITRLVNSKRDELPIDKDNHGMDATRYMVAFADSLADDPEDVDGILIPDVEGISISPY